MKIHELLVEAPSSDEIDSKFVAKRFSSERDVVKELATVFDVIKKHKT